MDRSRFDCMQRGNARTPQQAGRPLARSLSRTGGVLAASDAIGAAFVAGCSAATMAGIWLSASELWLAWVAGQALLAVALLQWFVLLHEAGHLTLFRARTLNVTAGHLAGLLALIPFESWRRVHGLHHRWTGWQDLDPTTASLAPRVRGRVQRAVVDTAWRLWLPLFSVLYRLGNYWNLVRLSRMFPSAGQRRAVHVNAIVLASIYLAVIGIVGPVEMLRLFAVALLLSLALQDPLILSQHTHIPQRLSDGRKVTPLSPSEQETYTRSLRCPRLFAYWVLLNFNAHELHHRYAGVPGYRLHGIEHTQANEVHWWTWLRAAKRLRGSVFLFENRDSTGFRW
jgi:acyl-lipid omega-6 desaturase (Delta-12 desaturase)